MATEERPEDYRPEQHTAAGRPMVSATPRDVVFIRIGSFIVIFLVAIGAVSIVAGVPWVAVGAGILAVVALIVIITAVRKQRTRGAGEAG
jgi:membrane protein YdbS with pleckstrin-like domain